METSKNAENMFNRIGFETSGIEEDKLLYDSRIMGDITIEFDLIGKTYFVNSCDCFGEEYVQAITVSMHEAITQQLKELGWLNE